VANSSSKSIAPTGLLSTVCLVNIGIIALLVLGFALISAEVINPAELMLAAMAATGAAWGFRRAGSFRLSKSRVIVMMASLFPIIIAIFVLRSFVAEPFAIPSGSMMPTLQEGDLILVNRNAYGLRLPLSNRKFIETGRPARGDVVVFRSTQNQKIDYIKRVVGIPGDLVVYANKELSINGQRAHYTDLVVYGGFTDRWLPRAGLLESIGGNEHSILQSPGTPAYNPKQVMLFPHQENCAYRASGFSCRVPDGQYMVLGDNRDASYDSRYWGFVPDENLIGRASIVLMNFRQLGRIGMFIE
jgi:signal peptidase I